MVSIIAIFFISISSFASSLELPKENEYAYGDRGQKDFRVDSNRDGKTDIWKVKTDNTVVSVGALGKKNIQIHDVRNGELIEVAAEEKNGNIRVVSIGRSPLTPINHLGKDEFEKLSIECNKLTNDRMSKFSSELNSAVLSNKMGRLWADSCMNLEGFEDYQDKIETAFISTFKVDGGKNNSLLNCLEKAREQSSDENRAEVSLLILQAKDKISDFYQDKMPKGLLSCSKGNSDSISMIPSSAHLRVNIKDGSSFSPSGLKHSLLTSVFSEMGLRSDQSSEIANLCLKGDVDAAAKAILKACNGGWTETSRERISQSADVVGTKIASNSELAGINKKLAETKVTIPTAEETSPMALAAIERTQGPEAAQRVARSQSSSLMNAANTVLGAVSSPAVASSRSLASNNASSNRESIKFGESVVGKRLPASAVKARGIASDETIVEEIDLSKRSRNTAAAARTKATASAANTRSPASSNGGSNVEATALSDEGGQELGRAGSGAGPSAAGSGGSRGSLLSESSSPVGQQTQARSASRSGGATASPAREEVVSYFRNADYTQARRKLRDPNFIKILKDNSISVMDLAGNSFGATRGSTIFLDQGDRFVRQK